MNPARGFTGENTCVFHESIPCDFAVTDAVGILSYGPLANYGHA